MSVFSGAISAGLAPLRRAWSHDPGHAMHAWVGHTSHYAHLIIDPQTRYCDSSNPDNFGNIQTEAATRNIARRAPEFTQLGITNFWFYFTKEELMGTDKEVLSGFHNVAPSENHRNILMPKLAYSAFEGSDIHAQLQKRGVKHLLISGVNLSTCVLLTAESARDHGYQVTIVRDCCADNTVNMERAPRSYAQNKFKNLGIHVMSSELALEGLTRLAKSASAQKRVITTSPIAFS